MPPEHASDEVDVRVQLAALQAAAQVGPPAVVGRAVLQELRQGLAFAFGMVMRIADDGAEVVAAYPGALAGIEPEVAWSPLDSAERSLARSGEPSLDGELRLAPGDRSPLTRLPAFGMRSVLRVPLFHRGEVAGCVSLYSETPSAFSARDGLALERYVAALGARVAEAEATASAPAVAAPSEPQPAVESRPETREFVDVESSAADEAATEEAPPVAPTGETTQRERLTALGEVVSGIAHELNNPLTTILGYAQLLPTLEGGERASAADQIAREAQRAGRIVRNLLYFARQHRPRVEPVDVNAVLARIVEVRRHHLAAQQVRVEAHLFPTPELVGDQYQLEQVFLHLLNNAQQALQPEGGTVTITSRPAGNAVWVSVEDTGPGIPPAHTSRIFEPFFTTREVGEGTGLGLSIAYGIVRAHGGRLWVEQGATGGARFVVELPLPDEAQAPTALVPGGPLGRGERVLVAASDAAVRALVTELLGASGYAVLTAASGYEAIEQLIAGTFDLVVASAQLGDRTALALEAEIAERWPRLRARMVVLGDDLEGGAMPAGVLTLPQPFSGGELLEAVRAALDAPDAGRNGER